MNSISNSKTPCSVRLSSTENKEIKHQTSKGPLKTDEMYQIKFADHTSGKSSLRDSGTSLHPPSLPPPSPCPQVSSSSSSSLSSPSSSFSYSSTTLVCCLFQYPFLLMYHLYWRRHCPNFNHCCHHHHVQPSSSTISILSKEKRDYRHCRLRHPTLTFSSARSRD